MPPPGEWRSAWPWRCRQLGARLSRRLDGDRRTAVRIGEGAGVPAGALVPGVIAGGDHTDAGAAGGNCGWEPATTVSRARPRASCSQGSILSPVIERHSLQRRTS